MIFFSAIFATSVCIIYLLFSPVNGVLVTVMLKPLIDASWKTTFFGVNCLKLIGLAVPLIILPQIIWSREKPFFDMPLASVGVAFFVAQFVGITGLFAVGDVENSIDYLLRSLNGFLGFFMFQYYFNDREKFKKLLLFILIGGLFPIGMGIYQAATGTIWELRMTSLGLVRNVGLYHDSFSFRAYSFQVLTAIILFLSYYAKDSLFRKISLTIYAIACIVVLYNIYSKAAIVIFCIWILIWSLFNRRALFLLMVPSAFWLLTFSTGSDVIKKTERVFMKEIGAYKGTSDAKYVLSGRTVIWKVYWKKWEKRKALAKFIGLGKNPPVHNDFFRVLYCNGIVGLITYIVILAIIGWKLLMNLRSRASPLNIVSVMVFTMWIMDSFGLHPTLYPAYQWFVWGFISLALRGVDGLDEPEVETESVGQGAVVRV